MSYIVVCTFDLENATSQDYKDAYSDLEKLGLRKVAANTDGGNTVIPSTTVAGEFTGEDNPALVKEINRRVKSAFSSRGFKSEIFVVAGTNWAWEASAT